MSDKPLTPDVPAAPHRDLLARLEEKLTAEGADWLRASYRTAQQELLDGLLQPSGFPGPRFEDTPGAYFPATTPEPRWRPFTPTYTGWDLASGRSWSGPLPGGSPTVFRLPDGAETISQAALTCDPAYHLATLEACCAQTCAFCDMEYPLFFVVYPEGDESERHWVHETSAGFMTCLAARLRDKLQLDDQEPPRPRLRLA